MTYIHIIAKKTQRQPNATTHEIKKNQREDPSVFLVCFPSAQAPPTRNCNWQRIRAKLYYILQYTTYDCTTLPPSTITSTANSFSTEPYDRALYIRSCMGTMGRRRREGCRLLTASSCQLSTIYAAYVDDLETIGNFIGTLLHLATCPHTRINRLPPSSHTSSFNQKIQTYRPPSSLLCACMVPYMDAWTSTAFPS